MGTASEQGPSSPEDPTDHETVSAADRSVDLTPAAVQKSNHRWVTIAGVATAVAAMVVVVFLYVQATGDKNEAEDALALAQSDLDDTNELLALAEARARDLDDRVADAEANIGEANEIAVDFLADSLGFGLGDDKGARCIAEEMVEAGGMDVLRLMLNFGVEPTENAFVEGLGFGAEMLQAAVACDVAMDTFGPFGTLASLEGLEGFDAFDFEEGFGYGDNPTLDALYDECEAGSGSACDRLFDQSEFGTMYGTFAGTCGGRFKFDSAPLFCEGNI